MTDVQIFSDKKSGRRANRPGYQKLLGLVIAGQVKFVVAYKLDRISRSVQDLLTFATVCRESDCHFTFAASPEIDTSSAVGSLMFTILGAVAAFESQMTSERVRDGMAQKILEGRKFGGDRKSYDFNKARVAPFLFREKPYQLHGLREHLRMTKNTFYGVIERMEQDSSGYITDDSDERYKAASQPFKYKRVTREGKYLRKDDPRLVLISTKRNEAALRHVAEFFRKFDSDEKVASFVEAALDGLPIARDLEDIDLELD